MQPFLMVQPAAVRASRSPVAGTVTRLGSQTGPCRLGSPSSTLDLEKIVFALLTVTLCKVYISNNINVLMSH